MTPSPKYDKFSSPRQPHSRCDTSYTHFLVLDESLATHDTVGDVRAVQIKDLVVEAVRSKHTHHASPCPPIYFESGGVKGAGGEGMARFERSQVCPRIFPPLRCSKSTGCRFGRRHIIRPGHV